MNQSYVESQFDMLLVGPGELRSVGPETGRKPKNGIGRYRCIYGSTRYVFYVDGKEAWRTKASGVSQVPEYLLLTEEIGDWGGDIKKADLPDLCEVDYVRVYEMTK